MDNMNTLNNCEDFDMDDIINTFMREDEIFKDLQKSDSIQTPTVIEHTCTSCSKTFSTIVELDVHSNTHKREKRYGCSKCEKKFRCNSQLICHLKTHEKIFCDMCEKAFTRRCDLTRHLHKKHNNFTKDSVVQTSTGVKTALVKRENLTCAPSIAIFENEFDHIDFLNFFNYVRECALDELKIQLNQKLCMKWGATVQTVLSRNEENGDINSIECDFQAQNLILQSENDLIKQLEQTFIKIMELYNEFMVIGEGWFLSKIMSMQLIIEKY